MSAKIPTTPSLARLVQHATWNEQTVGQSGGSVFRLDYAHERSLFIKYGAAALADAIADEHIKLNWLQGRASVPDIVHFEHSDGQAWLVTGAVPGVPCHTALLENADARHTVVESVARTLRSLHTTDVASCPFDASVDHRLLLARSNIDRGAVDPDDFDDERAGWTVEQVWQRLLELRPQSSEAVVAHGDYSLDNVFVSGLEVSGLIDVGGTARADRYQDLALMWRDLSEFGADLQDCFLEAYGLTEIDSSRLEFYLCLDELF